MLNNPPPTRRVRSAHESKSASVRAAAAAPSRRQQSRWQREQYQQRSLYLAIGGLLVVVALIFIGGIIYDNVIRAREVVAQVGPDSITASQLLDQVRQQSNLLDAQAKQQLQQFGSSSSASIAQYVDQQKRSLPDQTLTDMIDQKLIEQEAARRGISVSAAELDDKERETVAEFQAASTPVPTPDAAAAAATASVPDAAGAATPAAASAPDAAATPAAAAVSTPDASATAAAASPTLATTPTAVPTLDAPGYGPALQQLLDRNSLTEAQLRDSLQKSMLRDKLQAAIGEEQVPATQEQIHARHILVPTLDQANDVLAQLQAGADFAQLAQQVSTDTASKDKGGDLGWFGRGVMNKPFEDAAFALQPGQLSDVVQSPNGYHIIQVLERDPARPVPADQLETQRQKAFTDWLSARRSSQDVKLQFSQSAKDWVLAHIGVRP